LLATQTAGWPPPTKWNSASLSIHHFCGPSRRSELLMLALRSLACWLELASRRQTTYAARPAR